jgi:hypothetical protein
MENDRSRWEILSRGDMTATVLISAATVFCAGALFWPRSANLLLQPFPLVWIAPLVGVAFIIALFAMFAEVERHGMVRMVLVMGAVTLAVTGVIYANDVTASRILLTYWLPSLLAMGGAITLVRSHRLAHHNRHSPGPN